MIKDDKNLDFFNVEVPNTEKNFSVDMIDHSFIDSNNIHDMEKGLRKAIFNQQKMTLSICLGFYFIGERELYKELGYKNYSDYIKSQTIISYTTAWEYFYIGQKYILYKEEFERIGFSSNDGLYKLKVFPKKFDENKKEELLIHLKNDSHREFKQYVRNLKKISGRPLKKKRSGSSYTLSEVEDEALSVLKKSKAIQKEINSILNNSSKEDLKEHIYDLAPLFYDVFINTIKDISKKHKIDFKR